MIYARSAISFLVLLSSADAQQVGTLKTEKHPQLTVQKCTKTNGCATEQKSVVVDSNWRWTHKVGEAKDCYHGNSWDPTLCPDAATCAKNCALEGADEEYENTYGIKASGAELKLGFVTQARRSSSAQNSSAQFSGARAQPSLSSRSLSSSRAQGAYSKNIGSRTYLLDDDETYKLFKLKNAEFSFDVDVSKLPCGLNGARRSENARAWSVPPLFS